MPPQCLELVGRGAQRLGLRLAHLAQSAEGGLQRGQPVADDKAEAGYGAGHCIEADAPLGGFFSLGDVAGQALLDLAETSTEKGPSFLDGGGADLEVPAQRGNGAGALRQPAAGRPFSQGPLALLGGRSLELGQQRQQLSGPVEVACSPLLQL